MYPMPPRTKSADPATAARVRAVVREILNRDFGGNRIRMAARLGVSQPTISDLLLERKGPGPVLLAALTRYDPDLARHAWGLDVGGDSAPASAIAEQVAAYGVEPHVARVVSRAAIELGHDGDGAVRVARALATIVSALAPPGGSSRTPDAAVETPRTPRRARRAQ